MDAEEGAEKRIYTELHRENTELLREYPVNHVNPV